MKLSLTCHLRDRAWFQRLKLNYDEPLSSFAFNYNLRLYSLVMLSGVKRIMIFPPDQTPFLYRVGAVGKCKHATPKLPGGPPCPGMSAATWNMAGGGIWIKHSPNVESPPHRPGVCMSIHPEG